MAELRRFWRVPQGGGTEVLQATFKTHAYGRHVHERYVFGVVTRGAEAFQYRGVGHVAGAGDIVVLNPDEVHDGQGAGPDGWTYQMSYLVPEAFCVEGARSVLPFFPQAVVRDPPLAVAHTRLLAALAGPSSERLAQDSLFAETLRHLVERQARGGLAASRGEKESEAVRQVRDYLGAHYAESVALEDLAALVGLTPLYLIKVFRRTVGLPPHAYQIQRRVLAAMAALRQGEAIADVAAQCGFADQSHLTRQFKRVLGVTPGAFKAGSFKKLPLLAASEGARL